MKVGILACGIACSGLALSLEATPAAASYCTDTSVAALTAAPYTTHWGAYGSLACLEEHFVAAGDRRAIFASVYTLTTLRMAESIDAGEYANSTWMRSYQTQFADRYRAALHAYVLGQRSQVPSAWLKAFDAAAGGQTLIIQDVLLGMNAHINFDLPFAIAEVTISPNTWTRYADHSKVNAVLAEVSDEIIAALGDTYGASYAALDSALGPFDELLLATGMATARQNAWNDAVLLTASAPWNRWLVVAGIDAAAVTSASVTLGLTLSPTLRNTLRTLEGSNPGSTFCQHFPCSI
jgi:Family of unknown function (DUF5995)